MLLWCQGLYSLGPKHHTSIRPSGGAYATTWHEATSIFPPSISQSLVFRIFKRGFHRRNRESNIAPAVNLVGSSPMVEIENHFTVFIRLPFNRGDFIDPPPVAWSAAKERALWDVISRQAKGNEIDWRSLSEKFEVTQSFLLQQAAWLYERQLSQVRAQMRRVGYRQSATPSPSPSSMAASMVGGQAMKRGGSGGSRVPSRLSTQALGSPSVGTESNTPITPAKSRGSIPFRAISGTIGSQSRPVSGTSRPVSRQSSKEGEAFPVYGQSRRGSMPHQLIRSPGHQVRAIPTHSSDSEDEMSQSKITARRPNPSSIHRRTVSLRKDQQSQQQPSSIEQGSEDYGHDNDDDDDDSPSFLPFANTETHHRHTTSPQDPSATLRGGFTQSSTPTQRPHIHRRSTSERISAAQKKAASLEGPRPLASSTSSLSSNQETLRQHPARTTSRTTSTNPTTPVQTRQTQTPAQPPTRSHMIPLSPHQQAVLASAAGAAAGRSPRRPAGSDTSPSMGSSFSDLDDTSVTQSALEEALMSNMGNTTATMASRVSGISQALRSRYFDARGHGQGHGHGHNHGYGHGHGHGQGQGQGPGHQQESER